MTISAPLHVALIDQDAFFRTSVAAWLSRHVPGGASVRTFPSWDTAVQNGLAGTDVVLLDIHLPCALALGKMVRVFHTAHIRTLLVAPGRSRQVAEQIGDADAHGLVFRTDPVATLLPALEDLPTVSAHSFDLPQVTVPALPRLTPHQRDVVQLDGSGLTIREVAERMGLSRHTAETYLKEARARYEKSGLDIRTKTRLAMHAGFSSGIPSSWG